MTGLHDGRPPGRPRARARRALRPAGGMAILDLMGRAFAAYRLAADRLAAGMDQPGDRQMVAVMEALLDGRGWTP
jgi:hypothetical protein